MKAGKIVLFLILFGLPLLFLYPLAKGKSNSKDLPYFGKSEIAAKNQKIKDFEFYDVDSNVVNSESTLGRTLVITTLIPSCPTYCPIVQKQLKFLVYDKLFDKPEFSDLLFISHLIDTNGTLPDLKQFMGENKNLDSDIWKIVVGDDNPIYDFELPEMNLKQDTCPESMICVGGKAYYQMILLVDRKRNVRGLYQGNQTPLIKGLRGDIRKLFVEYVKEDKAKK